jgi:hypothetical protein
MTTHKTLLALVLFPMFATAATDHINIKPGLWEVTTSRNSTGTPMTSEQKSQKDAAMAKMSPEMRAQVEAMQKDRKAKQGQAHVIKSCVTQEDLNNPNFFDGGSNCTRKVLKSTSTMQEVQVSCTMGTHTSNGTIHIEAPTPVAWTGTMDTTMVVSGRDMKAQTNMSGKWLGADCGDVKPISRK